jgi:hypothetical protein
VVRRSAAAELSFVSVPSKQIPLAYALFWVYCGPSLAVVRNVSSVSCFK